MILLIQLNGIGLPGLIFSPKIQARNKKGHIYSAGVLKQHLGLPSTESQLFPRDPDFASSRCLQKPQFQ